MTVNLRGNYLFFMRIVMLIKKFNATIMKGKGTDSIFMLSLIKLIPNDEFHAELFRYFQMYVSMKCFRDIA